MTPRISPHAQSPHTTIDYLAALTQSRISSGYLRIPCPAHGGTNPNLALWVNDDGIAARCHSAGCSYADIAAAIETRYGISINPRRYTQQPHHGGHQGHDTSRTPEPRPKAQDLRPHALRLWHHSVPIPNSLLIIPPGCGLPTAASMAARATPTLGQCAGSAPNTCTASSRAPAP